MLRSSNAPNARLKPCWAQQLRRAAPTGRHDRIGEEERRRHRSTPQLYRLFLEDGFYPLNVLNTLKMVPEPCSILCATANPTEVVWAEMDQGRGILGVVDGFSPKGIEDDGEIQWRNDFVRQIGYKQ